MPQFDPNRMDDLIDYNIGHYKPSILDDQPEETLVVGEHPLLPVMLRIEGVLRSCVIVLGLLVVATLVSKFL